MNKQDICRRIFDGFIGIIILTWFFIPVSVGAISESIKFMPFNIAIIYSKLVPNAKENFFLYLIYLVPLFGLFQLTSLFFNFNNFLKKSLLFFVTSIMLFCSILPILTFAESIEYFKTYPIYIMVSVVVVFCINIISVLLIINILNNKNKIFREYKEFKISQKLKKDKTSFSGFFLIFRIRTKLLVSFISIISLILLVLSTQLLGNYKDTLIQAIGDGAKSQVEQAGANYRINIGDNIALTEYFNRQVELNQRSKFQYESLSLFTNLKTEIYLEDSNDVVPEFPCEYSTSAMGERFPNLDPITSTESLEYIEKYRTDKDTTLIKSINNFKFVSPIIKIDTIKNGELKIKKSRVLGFSIMTFDRDVIMKPYFKIRNKVIFLTALFIYISIILIYLVGNYIVNPILFLRMNVRKISEILSTMVKGETRISSSDLIYNDSITSRDEIKFLSTEINDMVTVIRGIIPYISASTLKHAETGQTSSVEKNITFLFTDIRGFTNLCEGMAPNDVVSLLNHYLDLETEIIIKNGGDVDKFVGDEVMAFFEGENRELNACKAAMEIRHAMMAEKEKRENTGLTSINIGIGIHTGPVVFGSVGARDRMDFTSIGDTVNLAARLEGANKAYGSKSMISESVYHKVKDEFLCRELDFITVKGKNHTVQIYEILQENKIAKSKIFDLKSTFEAGLAQYREQNWDSALEFFIKNKEMYNDEPSKIFIDRIEHFKNNPPKEDWDGVFRMTVK